MVAGARAEFFHPPRWCFQSPRSAPRANPAWPPEVIGVSLVARDIRMTLAVDEEMPAGLPQYSILHDRMKQLLLQFRRDGRLFALHLVSLVADVALPPEMQDAFHQMSAERLRRAIRGIDTVTKMGKHYVVVQSEIVDTDAPALLTERLSALFHSPIVIAGSEFFVTVRIGTVLVSRRTSSVDELLAEADLALARQRVSVVRRVESP